MGREEAPWWKWKRRFKSDRRVFSIQKMLLCLTRELVCQDVLPDPILWGLLFQLCV